MSINGIKSWAEEDRPREKLLLKGRNALSDAELLAILISSGHIDKSALEVAREILNSVNYNITNLAKLEVNDLKKIKGIGPAKALTIIAALELGRRKRGQEADSKGKVICSADCYEVMQPVVAELPHEEFYLLMLNNSNRIIGKHHVSKGGITGTITDPRVIFRIAIEYRATKIVLCHNHPSGSHKPSDADIRLTKKLKEAGEALEIQVVDHIIISEEGYFSFADEGMI